MTSLLARLAGTGIAAGALICLGATSAHAGGTGPSPLRADDRAAATRAATSAKGSDLALRVATLNRGTTTAKAGRVPAIDATPRAVAGTTTEVHVLSRDFVADGTGPVGELGYVSTTVRVADQLVSVWSAQPSKGGAWQAVNAATGDVESAMKRRAGDGELLSEPQVGAWYSVEDGTVRPLNAEARKAVGQSVSLDEYQRIVHDRYADKLPGSAYDRSGAAGGFDDPADEIAASAPPSEGPSSGTMALGGAGAVTAAGLLAARRRRARE